MGLINCSATVCRCIATVYRSLCKIKCKVGSRHHHRLFGDGDEYIRWAIVRYNVARDSPSLVVH